MLLSDGLARFLCRLGSAVPNEIDIPVFRTNTSILEFPQKTAMVRGLYELQGLARTSPQGALGMDEL